MIMPDMYELELDRQSTLEKRLKTVEYELSLCYKKIDDFRKEIKRLKKWKHDALNPKIIARKK